MTATRMASADQHPRDELDLDLRPPDVGRALRRVHPVRDAHLLRLDDRHPGPDLHGRHPARLGLLRDRLLHGRVRPPDRALGPGHVLVYLALLLDIAFFYYPTAFGQEQQPPSAGSRTTSTSACSSPRPTSVRCGCDAPHSLRLERLDHRAPGTSRQECRVRNATVRPLTRWHPSRGDGARAPAAIRPRLQGDRSCTTDLRSEEMLMTVLESFSLAGLRALLVTGATRGLGRPFARCGGSRR